jgi:hypothetical protein
MFPQLRQRLGPALDMVVEFSTLGEYRLGADGVVHPASALVAAFEHHAPQLGGAGDHPIALRAAVRHTVAGGAVGGLPAATPAARRARPARPSRVRRHVTGAPEQLCFAV